MSWQIWRLELLLTGVSMALLIAAGGRSLAQINSVEQAVAEERRADRRIDALQKSHDDLRLEIERRLTRIETHMGTFLTLLGLLGAAVVGQFAVRLFDLLSRRSASSGKNGGP